MSNTITDRLVGMDPTLKAYNEGHWDTKGAVPQTVGEYHSFNDAGVECETGEFLYGLIRVTQARRILETGTHWGIGAAYMGLALKDNGIGVLDTLEFLPEIYVQAQERIKRLDLEDHVKTYLIDAKDFPLTNKYDLIFLDTEPGTRFSELIRFAPLLNPGGFLFIHDLHRHMGQVQEVHPDHPETPFWPYGRIPHTIKQMILDGELRPFHFATPRGLTGFYKPHPEDHKWQ